MRITAGSCGRTIKFLSNDINLTNKNIEDVTKYDSRKGKILFKMKNVFKIILNFGFTVAWKWSTAKAFYKNYLETRNDQITETFKKLTNQLVINLDSTEAKKIKDLAPNGESCRLCTVMNDNGEKVSLLCERKIEHWVFNLKVGDEKPLHVIKLNKKDLDMFINNIQAVKQYREIITEKNNHKQKIIDSNEYKKIVNQDVLDSSAIKTVEDKIIKLSNKLASITSEIADALAKQKLECEKYKKEITEQETLRNSKETELRNANEEIGFLTAELRKPPILIEPNKEIICSTYNTQTEITRKAVSMYIEFMDAYKSHYEKYIVIQNDISFNEWSNDPEKPKIKDLKQESDEITSIFHEQKLKHIQRLEALISKEIRDEGTEKDAITCFTFINGLCAYMSRVDFTRENPVGYLEQGLKDNQKNWASRLDVLLKKNENEAVRLVQERTDMSTHLKTLQENISVLADEISKISRKIKMNEFSVEHSSLESSKELKHTCAELIKEITKTQELKNNIEKALEPIDGNKILSGFWLEQ